MEPVSPELALVDPELARAHLAWLERSEEARPASLEPPREARERPPAATEAPTAAEAVRPASWRTGALKLAVALSLGVNGFLVAGVVARDHPSPTAQTPATGGVLVPPNPPDVQVARTAASVRASAAIEQRLLALIFRSHGAELPSAWVDTATGLPKNGLQASCHRGPSHSQLCVVRSAQSQPGEGIRVRYTQSQDGPGTFTWSPYRATTAVRVTAPERLRRSAPGRRRG